MVGFGVPTMFTGGMAICATFVLASVPTKVIVKPAITSPVTWTLLLSAGMLLRCCCTAAADGECKPGFTLTVSGAAVESLPPLQREAFLLHEEGELTLEEIAQVTECGRETAKSRLRYALSRLREWLEDLE